MEQTHILSVWVENKFGVLSKVSGLFASRGYNIQSLAVGETEDPTISRMTIVVKGDSKTLEQVKKQLHKLIDTIKIVDFVDKPCIDKEICFIKVNSKGKDKTEMLTLIQTFGYKVIDMGLKALSIEIADTTKKINDFIKIISPFGILEVARSGVVAIAEEENKKRRTNMLDMNKINDLYINRYGKALEIIQEIHRIIDEGDYKQLIDLEQKN